MKLYAHQQRDVDLNYPQYGFWYETGAGKTITLLELAKRNTNSITVVCPKSIKERWDRDIWDLEREHDCFDVFGVLSKEEFRRDHKDISSTDAIIVDEAHHFLNPKSQLHKALLWYIKKYKPKFVWLATATPYRSSPWNVYALANILGYKMDWMKFRGRFFKEQYFGRRSVWTPRDDAESNEELQRMIRTIGSVVRLDECIDMPDAIFEEHIVALTREQKKAIAGLNEENPIVKYTKVHQMENGTLKGNEFSEDKFYKSNKYDYILEQCETIDKLAIFCRYRLQEDAIADALTAKSYNVYRLNGSTKDADAVIRDAESADRCIIIINTEKAEGYELPSFRHVIYASLPWSLVSWTQSLGRFRRINKPQRVHYTILTSDGEVDKAVKASLDKKIDFNLSLFSSRIEE